MNTSIDYMQKSGHSGQNWSLTSFQVLTPEHTSSYQTGQSHRERHSEKKRKLLKPVHPLQRIIDGKRNAQDLRTSFASAIIRHNGLECEEEKNNE